ncbi:acetate/propionate family kinase [Marivita sp.]|uniref:acetate/propionate family kinase n=1 Tax=Marivita sp. TaxID=2003365 RepID=UPI003F70B2D0
MTNAILVLNAGSSSLKFAIYGDGDGALDVLLRGKISGIGSNPVFSAKDADGLAMSGKDLPPMDLETGQDDLIPELLDWVNAHQGGVTIKAVGHRVVHGGRHHAEPALITDALLAELESLSPLAPMHQPHNLAAIRCVAASIPGLTQVACFDTSFHRTQDRLAQLFALPRALSDEGIIRYGFHGLSYDYIASTLPAYLGDKANGRVIVAHLGSGASMCAMKNRRSVATSMGFTALDGLVMGRRCGTLDPGVILYLLQEKGLSATDISTMLYKESGLLGVSGISNDMAVLEADTSAQAQEAIDLFCHRATSELAALASTIGGLDALVFTAGIGENSARIRRQICDRLCWMGVAIDPDANDGHATRISGPSSDIDVLVIPTNEEVVVARATRALTQTGAGSD